MATLLLAGVGAAIGGTLLPAGLTVLGQTIGGAVIGQAIGATIGRSIDQSLLMPGQSVTGPRMDNLEVQKSSEGAALPVVEGRARVAGQVIWATRMREATTTTTQGGKGGGPEVTTTEYSYYANFAVALTDCTTGPIRHFGRIWADGKPLDVSQMTVRYYTGSETQTPDPLMVAKDGDAPAYRGVSYVVFEDMQVDDFARRIPNMTFEVWGPSGDMEDLVRGVDVIPGSTEFGYSPTVVTKQSAAGSTDRENAFRFPGVSDWSVSMDALENTLPNCDTVALVVAWFGSDLRANHCQIQPKVEIRDKVLNGRLWQAGGQTRATAALVSEIDGRPAFGSAPDDQSVLDAITDLKARGYRVVLYPFVMMDIEAGNSLPDRSGGTGQPAYPWRGRIGPEAGGGTVAAQVASFVGTAVPANFSTGSYTPGAETGYWERGDVWVSTGTTPAIQSNVPEFSGTDGWTFRRFILHLAALARNAGGVDAFLIGSEMVDMTTATDTAGQYPFVDALVSLAADVKTMLPAASVSYAADWSEYHSHRDGAEVYFHLDPLWSSADVDFIGIDNYLPISDWRPGTDHLDYDPAQGHTSPYVMDYLKGQIEGGEYWDYYYASEADRIAQIRTPITDAKPWVFRQKAIRDWWSNAHFNRPAGVEGGTSTAWLPSSKPVWFTEYGCPAVDLGANQPNVFHDATSSESALPHFSSGSRDDFAQRQYLRAMAEFWVDNGGAMLDPANMLVWAWDARPWPEFPRLTGQWSDGPNWRRGHWLNGRAGNAPAAEVLQRRLEAYYGKPPEEIDLSRCFGQADGIAVPGPLSFRDLMSTWQTALRLDASESGGLLRVESRSAVIPVADFTPDDLVSEGDNPLYQITTGSSEEAPRAAVIRYSDTDRDYEAGAARASVRERAGQDEAVADLALVSDLAQMTAAAEGVLRTAANQRETTDFVLPRSVSLRPGQAFTLTPKDGKTRYYVVDKLTRGAARKVNATVWTDAVFGAVGGPSRAAPAIIRQPSEVAQPYFMDLPLLPGVDMADHQGFVACLSDPWPGGVDIYRSSDTDTGFSLATRVSQPASVGVTTAPLPPGQVGLWSPEVMEVNMFTGGLVSRPELDVLDGANVLAVEHAPNSWEILQFRDAELIASKTWRLTGLLRGQLGTEWVRDAADLPTTARVVALDTAVTPVDMLASHINRDFFWRAVPVGKTLSDAASFEHTFTGMARRPYAPAHLAAEVSGSVLSLSWVRRSRTEADEWATSEPPLGETFERYLVEIGPEGDPDITVLVNDATTASGLDLTGLTGTLEVRVAQVSETYGPGTPARTTISV